MNEKLILIREKCIATNPEITKRRFYEGSGIRLADVLLAIEPLHAYLPESSDNSFKALKMVARAIDKWNLRADDLEKQPEETINFLAELLK